MKHTPTQEGNNSAPDNYLYRWDYNEQVISDRTNAQKAKRRGAVTYALVMVSFFLLLIGVLIFSVLWFGGSKNTTADVAEELLPSVVLIYAAGDNDSSYGTGFFIRSDGYIATNSHVVKGRDYISVTLYDGTEHEATFVGMSTVDDLAVIRIDGRDFPTVRIGNSEAARVGETAIAIGNPSGTDAPWTVTEGIVSAKDRIVTIEGTQSTIELTMLQFDAPVNSGNSGGPLCNVRGEVIGIVTRKLSNVEGIGLALPINGAMELLNAIIETGSVKGVVSSISRVRPVLGITVVSVVKGETYEYGGETVTVQEDGILISMVTPGSAADGILQAGDVIISMNGARLRNVDDLTEQLYKYRSGQSIRFEILRIDDKAEVTVTLN